MILEKRAEIRGFALAQLEFIVTLIQGVTPTVEFLLDKDTSYNLSSDSFKDIIDKIRETRQFKE